MTPVHSPDPLPNSDAASPPRRGFLTKALAALTGGLVVLIPAGAGIGFFLNPILRRGKSAGADGPARRDEEGFLRVTTLSALPGDGAPRIFTVYDDIVDAWNKFVDEPIGRVYLRKLSDGAVTAFNVRCPHLGCAVDFRPAQRDYFCPCHTSAFDLDGAKKNAIPPRGMDSLDVKIKNADEVWVRFQSFRAGTPGKIAIS